MTLTQKLLGRLPAGAGSSPCGNGLLLHVRGAALASGSCGAIVPPKVLRWLALHRNGPYWMQPSFGGPELGVPDETQFLLWQRTDRLYGLLLPLVCGDLRAALGSNPKGLVLAHAGALPGSRQREAILAHASMGRDPYRLIAGAMRAVADLLGTLRLRTEKPVPAFVDLLGWCTWDAFYHTVDARKLMQGIASFHKGGMAPGFVMLDDGWEDRDGDLLNSFEPLRAKFPQGLKTVVKKAKRRYGVRIFGIHHPFQGYWGGVNPTSDLGRRYRLIANRNVIRPWLGPQKDRLYLVHPSDIHRFYNDFYRYLRAQGIDMVKVDGQSALELFTEGKLGRVSTMQAYQEALQGAAAVAFGGQIIPCMSNGSDVLYHLSASNGWRNSTDYFPGRPAPVQQFHVFVNAMNNLWSSTFAIPDWDMFQSHTPEAAFHAAARAISGGPVYVCDKPGRQNFALIRKLCTSDGRLLRCEAPALVTRDRMFVNTHSEPRLLKVFNRNGPIGMLGIFHCRKDADDITDTFRASDVEGLQGKEFAVYRHDAGSVTVASRGTPCRLTLGPMQWELVTLSAVADGVAPLGLLDKFNSSRAITSVCRPARGTCVTTVCDGGLFGAFCGSRPSRVLVNGRAHRFEYQPSESLLRVPLTVGQRATVTIQVR